MAMEAVPAAMAPANGLSGPACRCRLVYSVIWMQAKVKSPAAPPPGDGAQPHPQPYQQHGTWQREEGVQEAGHRRICGSTGGPHYRRATQNRHKPKYQIGRCRAAGSVAQQGQGCARQSIQKGESETSPNYHRLGPVGRLSVPLMCGESTHPLVPRGGLLAQVAQKQPPLEHRCQAPACASWGKLRGKCGPLSHKPLHHPTAHATGNMGGEENRGLMCQHIP